MGTVQWDPGGMSEEDNLHNLAEECGEITQADTREAEVLSCSIYINLTQPPASMQYLYLSRLRQSSN